MTTASPGPVTVKAPPTAGEQARRARLAVMRRRATALLVAVTIGFLVVILWAPDATWVGYVRAMLEKPFTLYAYPDERFAAPGFQAQPGDEMRKVNGGWEFDVVGTGFEGTFRVELDAVPEVGSPARLPE